MSKKKSNFVIIQSAQNQHFKQLKALRISKKAREQSQLIALFDRKAILEMGFYMSPKALFAMNEEDLKMIEADEKFLLKADLFNKASGLSVSQGLAAIYLLPKQEAIWPMRLLILDGVSDPGNLGTLIRSAFSFGFTGGVLLNNCSDPFNDKALRAAKGLTLRFWLKRMNVEELEKQLTKQKYAVFIADATGEKIETFPQRKIALVLGSEGIGVSKEVVNMGKTIAIKMASGVESLNVAIAGSILMYEIAHGK